MHKDKLAELKSIPNPKLPGEMDKSEDEAWESKRHELSGKNYNSQTHVQFQ